MITLHTSYMTALLSLLARDGISLDHCFEITPCNTDKDAQEEIRGALEGVQNPAVVKDFITHDVIVTSGEEAHLGYIRSYLSDDGVISWAQVIAV